MAIQLIPFQQFIFDQSFDTCITKDKLRYCQLVQEGDSAYIQYKQLGNGIELVTEGFGIGELLEKCPDGDFLLDPTTHGWTLGTGWTWDNTNHKLLHAASNATDASFTPTSSLINTALYQLTFTVEVTTGGTLTPKVGGNSGTAITASGTYTQAIRSGAGSTVAFSANSAIACKLSNVSFKYVALAWYVDNQNIKFNTTGAYHVPGAVSTLTHNNYLVANGLFKVVVTVANMTEGVVKIKGGGTYGGTATANGEHTFIITSDSNTIGIEFSEDCNGTVTSISAVELREDHQFFLMDLDGNFIADLSKNGVNSGSVTYTYSYDSVILIIQFSGLLDINGDAVDYGCYKICFVDPTDVVTNSQHRFNNGTTDWTLTSAGAANGYMMVDVGPLLIEGNATGTGTVTIAPKTNIFNASNIYPQNQIFKAIVNISIFTGDIDDASSTISLKFPDNNSLTLFTNVAPFTKYEYHGVLTFENETGNTFENIWKLAFAFNTINLNKNYIDEVIVQIIPVINADTQVSYDNEYYNCSNCLSYALTHDCTKVLEAISTDDFSLGFNWDGGFVLHNRLKMGFMNPSYPEEEEDYLYSNGSRQVTFASVEKYKIAWFDRVDEATHDNIAAMIKTDRFFVDNVEMYVKKGNYVPDWDKDGQQLTATSRVEMKRKSQTIVNSGA